MNLLSLIEKALKRSFQTKLKMSDSEANKSASEIIQKIQDYKPSEKEKEETYMFHSLGMLLDIFISFFRHIQYNDIDTISILSNDKDYNEIKNNYNELCNYEYSYKKYNKQVIRLLEISNIGNRTSLGQFLLHPSKKYCYFENEIIKAYIRGLKYWKRESKYMSENEESKLKSNIDKILFFYPFIKDNKEAMSIEIPKCSLE